MSVIQQHWHSRPRAERQRLTVALIISVMLCAWLGTQQWLKQQHTLEQWRSLYQLSGQLVESAELDVQKLGQLAQAEGVRLARLEPVDGGWSLQGVSPQLNGLRDLMAVLATQGWYPHAWNIDSHQGRFNFELVILPLQSREVRR
ncbi:MAG: hypothetical protein CMI01_09285 [Oceanospirillaceae bacterium]|nr:hypothetical protein [Oceanospirillaceae bacterium]